VWSQLWSQTTVNDGEQHVMRYRHEPGVSCVNDDGALRPRTFDNSRGEVESHGVERESNVALHINHLDDGGTFSLLRAKAR
jgi:hypothetical protein